MKQIKIKNLFPGDLILSSSAPETRCVVIANLRHIRKGEEISDQRKIIYLQNFEVKQFIAHVGSLADIA